MGRIDIRSPAGSSLAGWTNRKGRDQQSMVVTSTKRIEQNWLVVWTPLKNISQLGWLFPIYGKIKNVPNHQPEKLSAIFAGFCYLSVGSVRLVVVQNQHACLCAVLVCHTVNWTRIMDSKRRCWVSAQIPVHRNTWILGRTNNIASLHRLKNHWLCFFPLIRLRISK